MDGVSHSIPPKPWLAVWVTLALLLGLGGLIVWQWQALEASSQDEARQRFQLEAQDVGQRILHRMAAYETVLRGISGLMIGSDYVSPGEWQRAVAQLQLQDRYPGIQGLGWGRYVREGQLEEFLEGVKASGRANYQTFPLGPREEYVLIDYISPLDWRNRRAQGYDMFSEPLRREAIEAALNSGEAALTAPVILVQETRADVQAGMLLYLPVFRPGQPLTTRLERREALLGFVYGAFRSHDLMAGILGPQGRLFDIELSDRQAGRPLLAEQPARVGSAAQFRHAIDLPVYGRTWVLEVSSTPQYEASLARRSMGFNLWTALTAVGLLAALAGGYLYLRERQLFVSQRATEQLREREERFRMVVEASPNAIVLVDSGGQIAMANQQAEQLFGYPREELLDQPVELLLPEHQRHGHVPSRRGYLERPEPRRMGSNRELFGQHRDGRLIPLEVGLSPLRSGADTLVQAVIIDISERKEAEQRLRDQAEQLVLANRYKSEFLANMSHELRTPLNSVLILSDQLRQNSTGNLTQKQTQHADIIHRAGSDLLQLINSVLDLAKVESGRLQLEIESLDLRELLDELDASMRPQAELKGLRLHALVEPGVPARIHSDRARLQQILRNLLSNAVKFTEQGEVRLSVCPAPALDEPQRLSFRVQDTGIGIAAEQHEQIFQAFQQIDGSASRRFGGTGLGLAITRQLARALGGEVHVQSEPGRGSCFTLSLPVQAPVAPAGEALEVQPRRQGVGPAVLIVEDNASFASVLAEAAHAHGFASVCCGTGLQALELMRQERFRAVILDILLPDISGWQLYRQLRGQAEHRDTPVHIISSAPQPADWNDDGTRYLVKPISREDLERVFAELQGAGQAQAPALLLVEDVQVEREHYRQHLQQLGFEVVSCASATEALAAYAERQFAALVVDLDLPDLDGFDLLETLDRRTPLNGARVVINTGVDVTQLSLQRLRRYSAVVVRKQGEDLQALGEAVQGFLGGLRAADRSRGDTRPTSLAGRRVLLVDDDVRNVYALTALLDAAGIEVTSAKDGQEAIASYRQAEAELILMDMAMPHMDGYAATRVLKQEHGCTVPIIALTAHAMKGDREKCLAAGADDYLAKPVSGEELLSMLERWLNQPSQDARQSRAATVDQSWSAGSR
ncbi:response regulator [Pseudomonas sp. MBLB4136]|uniref:response regulator n=1 Tax=Pseudomonas sp. MBLB4136 TaxID=3451558 RepID=UPI003F74C06E